MNIFIDTRRARGAATGVVVAAFGLATLGADCNGNIVQDPTFRDWCGSSLCAWHTDHGSVARVPTWNVNDLGVSFADNAGGSPRGTSISQATQEDQARCILFTSVGDLSPGAAMTVSVDFDSDGTIEATATLGAASWKQVQAEITAPTAYHGITFHVTKSGSGTAILAEMRIQSTTGCTAQAPTLADLPLGDRCAAGASCAAGLVCDQDADAGLSLCSECSASAPCAGGVACARRGVFLPSQCAPGMGLGASGAPCLAGSDCASGACLGARPVPLLSADAGACDLDTLGNGDAANCSWFSAVGGSCR